MSVLVSGFLAVRPHKSGRTVEKYIDFAEPLLSCNLTKVVFVDKACIDRVRERVTYPESTVLIETDESEVIDWWPMDEDKVTTPSHRLESKDTIRYMRVIMYKTEWMVRAIGIKGDDKQYIWVDFGMFHIFKNDRQRYLSALEHASKQSYDGVRIGHIWQLPSEPTPRSFEWSFGQAVQNKWYDRVCWYFAGGVFGGNAKALRQFAQAVRRCKDECIRHRICTWEVNIWYIVFLSQPTLFQPYPADHKPSLLEAY